MKISKEDSYRWDGTDEHMIIYVTGAKHALNYRGFDDFMVYYTLLAMGVPVKYIDHIGKDERLKRENEMKLKGN